MVVGSRRYLQPEPLLQEPNWVRGESQQGFSAPTYAYARNNPLKNTDPTGLAPPGSFPCTMFDSTYSCCIKQYPYEPGACGPEPSPDDPVVRCTRRALAGYDICISSGKSVAVCQQAMQIMFLNCLAKERVPLHCEGNPGGGL